MSEKAEWELERPGILRLKGTRITIQYDRLEPSYEFTLWDGERVVCQIGILATAKAFAEQYIEEMREIGLEP